MSSNLGRLSHYIRHALAGVSSPLATTRTGVRPWDSYWARIVEASLLLRRQRLGAIAAQMCPALQHWRQRCCRTSYARVLNYRHGTSGATKVGLLRFSLVPSAAKLVPYAHRNGPAVWKAASVGLYCLIQYVKLP